MYLGGKGVGLSSTGVQSGTPNDWDFATIAERVYCRYAEVWVPKPVRSDQLELHGLALSLFEVRRGDAPKPILAVHAELALNTDDNRSRLKRGPHLHVDWAPDPIPHCHFALNLANLNNVVSSKRALGAALTNLVYLLREDVLPRYNSFFHGTVDWRDE
jgi:hypothetical protein